MVGRKPRTSPQQKRESKPVPTASRISQLKASLLSLESRLMFDAAAAATGAEVNQERVAQEQAEAAVSSDKRSAPENQVSVETQELLRAIVSYSPGERPTAVAFVDPTVPDYQSLILGMGANVQIVLLDVKQDGVEQIAASLAGRTELDAIHIISHGAEGQLALGTGTLSTESMSGRYADELATIRQSLSESADILVYGCDFAGGQAGRDAVTLLSQLTGADVAASTDDTGSAGLGGDWDFEFHTGFIETEVVINYDTQVNWFNVLGLTASGSETRINNTLTGTQTTNSENSNFTADSVAMDASGSYVSVWESDGNIYGKRYNSAGTAQGSEFVIASNVANERLASVARNTSGAFVVTWERDQGAGGYDIYARVYNAAGTAVGNEFLVNETTTDDQGHARVAIAADGSFVVMWESNTEASGTYYNDVYAQRYDAAGTKIGSNFLVNTTTSGNQADADIAMDSSGNFVVVWAGERTAGSGVYSIYGQRYDASGVAQGGEFLVNAVASSNDQHASVAMNDRGDFVVTWDRMSGGDADIQAQRFNSAGVVQGSAISVTNTALYVQTRSNVAMDQSGNFVVSWSSNNQDGSGWGVYTRQYDSTGTALTTERRVATTTTNDQGSAGIAYQNRRVVVTWSGNGTGDTSGMFMQRYSATGGNTAPTITSNGGGIAAAVSVGENTTAVTTVTATDPDAGATRTYSISGGADAAKFTINSSTGALRFITAPDYESPTDRDGNNIYDVIVMVEDNNGGADTQSIAVTVMNVNDAPVLTDTVLTMTVVEDAGAPSGAVGSPISAFTGGITDVDSGASKGIAITGSNQTNGTWYYTRNGGTTWTAVGTVSNTSALLLADNASTRLYFAPRANYNGTSTAALTLRAWDQTSGTAGSKVSTASNGGTTAFSSATDTVEVTVTAVNDAPTIASLSGDSRAYSEGAGAVVIESGNAVVADVDSTNLDMGTLTVSIPAGGDSAEDVLSIRNQGTGAGQIGVSGSTVTYQGVTIGTFTGGSGGTNLVITFNSNATPTAVTALVRNITYQNTDTNAPTTGARTVRFVLTDGDGGTSPNYNTTVTVSAVNDAPVLADTTLSLIVMEDAGVPSGAVGSLVSAFTSGITDVDSGASKGIAITGSNQTNGTWYYTRNGGTTWTAVGTVSNTSALLLADNSSTRLYFAPRANYNGTSTAALTLRAWDQTSGAAGTKVSTASNGGTTAFSSATDTVDVTVTAVNDAPFLVTNSGSTVAEGGTDTIDVSELAVTDADHTAGQLTYSIGTGPAHGRLELITAPGVSTNSFTQADIIANRLVYVHDGSETSSDSFTFTVSDGAGGILNATTMTLTITPVNDTPTITSNGGGTTAALSVAENVSAVTIVTGADVDLPAQALTYHISGGVDQALFMINVTTGALSFVAPPNFEVATDANGDNVYVVQVRVIDSQGASTTQMIQVTVTDVVEAMPPTSTAPLIPPVLLSTTASSPTGSAPFHSNQSNPAEPSTDTLPQFLVPQGSGMTLGDLHSTATVQFSGDSVIAHAGSRLSNALRMPTDLPQDQSPFTVPPVEPDPVQDFEPPEPQWSVSELLPSELDENAVSLENSGEVSEERYPVTTRIVALTATTLSVAFIAWALRSGAVLAGVKKILSSGGTLARGPSVSSAAGTVNADVKKPRTNGGVK